jgi:uncharacterized membrane protein (Fun14 family)
MNENSGNIPSIFSELPYLNMGASFLVGLAVGFALKKSFKLMLLLLGVVLILMFFLEYEHIITINQDQLLSFVDSLRESFIHFAEFLKDRVAQIKLSGTLSAIAGFFIGLKMG